MILLLGFAFLAGVVTILSPCILPLLPVILSSVDDSGKQRPFGVVVGFVASFTFFTLFLSTLVKLTGIPADALRLSSIVILIVFGLTLVIPHIQAKLEVLFSRLASLTPNTQNRRGFWGGLVVGVSLGLLWTPCVGPILASVISLAITGTVTTQAFFITLAYATGTAIPMFAIMLAGGAALKRVPGLLKNTANIQRAFGILMIATAVAIALNLDRRFQTWVLTTFPEYGTGLTQFEDTSSVQDQLNRLGSRDESIPKGEPMPKSTKSVVSKSGPAAPELTVGGQWFNSEPLTMESLRGKVVLVDFWTYSCINCQRTLPYLRQWWDSYKDDGLVIIGVHSPEFEFEKDPKNVAQALKDFDLQYPVMQDNDFSTWKAYNNRYWPAKYLIDAEGKIRYTHFGEGKYDDTEQAIQELLEEVGQTVSKPVDNPEYQTYGRTPETYLGSARIEHLASPERVNPGQATTFSRPVVLPANEFAYEGTWTIEPEYATPAAGSSLYSRFSAKQVFLVVRPTNGEATFEVTVDGKQQFPGKDVKDGVVTVTEDRLYELVNLDQPGSHELQLKFNGGVELYAFTFG